MTENGEHTIVTEVPTRRVQQQASQVLVVLHTQTSVSLRVVLDITRPKYLQFRPF